MTRSPGILRWPIVREFTVLLELIWRERREGRPFRSPIATVLKQKGTVALYGERKGRPAFRPRQAGLLASTTRGKRAYFTLRGDGVFERN